MTLYTQVAANRTKTWVYLSFYVALILAIGYVVSLYYGSYDILLLAGVISVIQGFVSLYFSDQIALATSGAEPLERTQAPELYRIVENLTMTAGLPMPRLFIISGQAINAFATGRDAQHAAIAVTEGALRKLNSNELQGVLAHELSHIGNEDIRLSSMVMVMAGLIALVSDIFMRSLWWGGGRRRDNDNNGGGSVLLIIAIAFSVLAPIAATLIQLAISRKREFMADSSGVLLTRYPDGLINALRKIEKDDEPVEEANRATAHLYFSNPLSGASLANLFSTHPPIEERIEALEKGSGSKPS